MRGKEEVGLIVSGLNHAMHPSEESSNFNVKEDNSCPDCPKNGTGTSHNSTDGNSYSFSDGAWHLVGPTMRTLGAELVPKTSIFAKYMFEGSRVVGGATKGTSVASLVLRKALPQTIGARILGTKVLGGVAGRLVPIIGEGLMIGDGLNLMYQYRAQIQAGVQARDSYIQQGLMPFR